MGLIFALIFKRPGRFFGSFDLLLQRTEVCVGAPLAADHAHNRECVPLTVEPSNL